jgi:adenylate cyclase
MKKFAFTIILLILVCLVRYFDPWIVESVRLKALDLHQRNQQEILIDSIVTVGVDNQTLRKYGQWPWPRDILAQQVAKVFEAGASLVVLPVLFSQPDRFGMDDAFVDLLHQAPVVIGQIPADELQGNPVPRGVVRIGDDWQPWLYEYATAVGPIAPIGKAAAGVGMMNAPPEPDGVVRRMPLVVQINGEMYPAIALETLRVASGEPSYQVKTGAGGIEAVRVPGFGKIITDPHASIWVNFRYRTRVHSLADGLPDLSGAVVILSPTASGINNPVPTPAGVIEGHDLIATTVATMLNGDFISRPYWANLAEIAMIAVLGLLCIILVMYSSWYISALFPLSIISIYFASAWIF